MLLLLFKVASRHYAIEAKRVLQVLPSTMVQRSDVNLLSANLLSANLPSDAYSSQVGLLQWQVNQQFELVPVIDLSQLLVGVSCPNTIGTRIMLVKDDASDQIWGLMASSMVETWSIDDELWRSSQVEQILMRDQILIYGLSVNQVLAQVRNSCDQFRVRTLAVERDRAVSQN